MVSERQVNLAEMAKDRRVMIDKFDGSVRLRARGGLLEFPKVSKMTGHVPRAPAVDIPYFVFRL